MLIFIIDDIIIRFEFHAMDDPTVFCILQYLLLKILISFNFTSEAILLYHLVPGKSNLTFSHLFRSLRKLRIFLIVNFIRRKDFQRKFVYRSNILLFRKLFIANIIIK